MATETPTLESLDTASIRYCYRPLDAMLTKSVGTDPVTGQPKAVVVTGRVTGKNIDTDSQIIDPDWATAALQTWLDRYANVRAMHGRDARSVVGKGLTLEPDPDGDGVLLTSRITDRDAIEKVLDGRYCGYSIGIGYPKVTPDPLAKRGRVRGEHIGEVSLVDAPAYPTAKLTGVEAIYKMAGSVDVAQLVPAEVDDLPADDAPDALDKSAIPGGITKKPGMPQSAPKGKPTQQDTDHYADPVNFAWPIDTPGRIRSAMAYFNAGKGKAKYDTDEWQTIGKRIAAAAATQFKAKYELSGDQIVNTDDAGKAISIDVLDEHGIHRLLDPETRDALGALPPHYWDKDSSSLVMPDLHFQPFPAQPEAGFSKPLAIQSEPPFTANLGTPTGTDHTAGATNPTMPALRDGDTGQFANLPAGNPDMQAFNAKPGSLPTTSLNPPSGSPFAELNLPKAIETVQSKLADVDLEKNGIAAAVGPSALNLLYAMLVNEVNEDGGDGHESDDIASIATAYDALTDFLCSEAAEASTMSFAAETASPDAYAALVAAVTKLAPATEKAIDGPTLGKCVMCGCACAPGAPDPNCGCDCAECAAIKAAAAGNDDDTDDDDDDDSDEKVVTIDETTYDLGKLAAAYLDARAQITKLQATLDVTPAPGGPLRFTLPAETQLPKASALDAQLAALRATRDQATDPSRIQGLSAMITELLMRKDDSDGIPTT